MVKTKSVESKYLAFLDIDGVLTSNRVHVAHNAADAMWKRFDPVAIDFLNYMHDTYDVEFVIMSTWALGCDPKNTSNEHWVHACFASAGFRGKIASPWKVNAEDIVLGGLNARAYAVKNYLEQCANFIDDFILFDDTQYDFDKILGKKRLVRTDSNDGLLFKHMLRAKAIMGNWKKK